MSNIVGEPIDDYVSKQIVNRQKIHGSANRDNSTLLYLNSKTSWVKATSGVVIKDLERLNRIGLGGHPSLLGTGLAKFFILFNGVSDTNNSLFKGIDKINSQNSSQDIGQSILNKVAYGLGGTEFGLRPMPGITSCETKFRNRGSIREGSIKIKAWSRTQLEIINLLYMRLGFPILLEWGHSIYINDEGKVDSNPNFSIASNFLDKKYKNDNEVLKALEEKRKESCGNYDAMYGRVTNFKYIFNKDGSYDIDIQLISIGAIIESLKMNVYVKDFLISESDKESDSDQDPPETDYQWIDKYKTAHSIGSIFWLNKQKLDSKDTVTDSIIPSSEDNGQINYIVTENEFYYIRFGEFLNILKVLIPSNTETSPSTPLLNIDKDSKYMFTNQFQISGDPRICIIGGFKIEVDNNQIASAYKHYSSVSNIISSFQVTNPEMNPRRIISKLDSNSFKETTNGISHGNINNIFVNMSFILSKLNDSKDENGKVNFIDLINGILVGINKALGNINQLECILDENTNTIKIIDQTQIPGIEKAFPELSQKLKESPEFMIYGYYNTGTENQSAGFIKDLSLGTEISNALSSMITIGATANGNMVGEDATAFSKWNKGLEPIINKSIDYEIAKTSNKPSNEQIQELIKTNRELEAKYMFYLDHRYCNADIERDELDGVTETVSNYLAYRNQLNLLINQSKTKQKPSPSATSSKGFLPINLSLTLDGLSGVKIYQQIKIDTSFLPTEYPTSLKFIIKGVKNVINNNKWDVILETVSIPVLDYIKDLETKDQSLSKKIAPDANPTDERATARNNKTQPNADNLRKTISQLNYKEKGKEIDNSGNDISKNIEKAVSSLLKTIKQELPEVQVTVTGGNDKYHQGLSYNSRHKQGDAVDITINPPTNSNLDKVVTILQRYAAGNSPNFRFIDEYRHLTSAGTGNHFHVSWNPGTEGQAALDESIKLAQQGKINPIKIS